MTRLPAGVVTTTSGTDAAISSARAKDFHIALGFLFDVEVFDDRGLRAGAEGAERVGGEGRGGGDGAAAVVCVAGFEDDGVLAVDEEVRHPAGVRREQIGRAHV